jgi:hypothetical protein
MRIPDLEFRLGGSLLRRDEAIQKTLDDRKSFCGFDLFGLLLLDKAVERGHDVIGVVWIEIAVPIVGRDVVFAREAVDRTLMAPDLLLLKFRLTQLIHLGEVSCAVLLLIRHAVDERFQADDIARHG